MRGPAGLSGSGTEPGAGTPAGPEDPGGGVLVEAGPAARTSFLAGELLPAERPGLGECLAAVFRCGRPAWSLRLLGPAWLLSTALWLVWTQALPAGGAGSGFAIRLLTGAGSVVAGVVVLALLALLAALAGWEFGRDERLGLFDGLAILRQRWRSVLGAPLLVLLGVAVLLGLLVGGSALLAALPVVGGFLSVAWLWAPGLALAGLAAGLIILGLPAVPLILGAGALEQAFPFDAASRGMSYVRARPSRYLAMLVSGLTGGALGLVAFAALIVLALAALLAARMAASGQAWEAFPDQLALVLGKADLAWPLPVAVPGSPVPAECALGALLPVLAGRLATAFALATFSSLVARAYLLLRWEVDGEPPTALVRPGEQFRWSD